jgi:hypothetical protein
MQLKGAAILRLAIPLALACGGALASDGRLEISQACVAAGCFPGDTPGFPVQTSAGQSYVLTSDLQVSDANTTAIQLNSNASLDLGGFSIEGITSCSASPTVCTNTGSGIGLSASSGSSVRNGRIARMGANGITGGSMMVENVVVEQNGGDGINGGAGPTGWLIHHCRIQLNGQDGIDLNVGGGADGALIEHNVIRRNGGYGVIGVEMRVADNAVTGNDSYGLAFNTGGGTAAGYVGNYLIDNNGGNANAQVGGGVQLGTNVCGGDTTCP